MRHGSPVSWQVPVRSVPAAPALPFTGRVFVHSRACPGLVHPRADPKYEPGAHVTRTAPGLTCRHTSANFLAVPGFCLETPGASGKVCKHPEPSIGPSQKASFAGNGRTIGGNDNALDRPGMGTRVPPNLYHRGFRTSGFSLQHPIVAAGETIQRGVFQAWIEQLPCPADTPPWWRRRGSIPANSQAKGLLRRERSGERARAGAASHRLTHAVRASPGPGHDIHVVAAGGSVRWQAGRYGPGLRRRVRSQAQIQRGRVFPAGTQCRHGAIHVTVSWRGATSSGRHRAMAWCSRFWPISAMPM